MHKQKLDLDDVKQNFEQWRGSRTKQGKIPDYLWAQTLNLIGRYNMSKIVQTLGMSTQQLKSKMNEVADAEFEALRQAHFAEVAVATTHEAADTADVAPEPPVKQVSKPSVSNVVPFTNRPAASTHDITITRKDGSTLTVSGMSRDDVAQIIRDFLV